MRRIGSGVAVALAVPCALFVIACGAGQAKGGGSTGTAVYHGRRITAKASKTATIGQPVRDGKFEFTVEKVKCGVTKVGDSLLNDKAQGQFCLVTLKVRNTGSEAQTLDDSSQYAFGTSGAKYDSDTAAGIDANNGTATFLNDINPGNSVPASSCTTSPRPRTSRSSNSTTRRSPAASPSR